MFEKFRRLLAGRKPAAKNTIGWQTVVSDLAARFNAASRSADSMKAFAGSDYLDADSAMAQDVRRLISSRARNEFANNSFAYGIIKTLANDTIGRGPRLQLDNYNASDSSTDSFQRRERRFYQWGRHIGLTEMLRCARMAKAIDGEAFIRLAVNPKSSDENHLDIRLYEPEYVASLCYTPTPNQLHDTGEPAEVDGIIYDRYGNPVKYRFWRQHPGTGIGITVSDSTEIPANQVLHYANIIRPGQHRGISEMLAALNIFNDLRRYSTAVVLAAEVAARLSFIVTNNLPAECFSDLNGYDEDGNYSTAADKMPTLPLSTGDFNALFLPIGFQASQMKPEQPTNTYHDFRDAKINEAARVFSMPYNVAVGNSSQYNYASGRLDHQVYHKQLLIERDEIEIRILNPIYESWMEIDRLIHPEDYMTSGADNGYYWMWDGFEHVDPVKEANAQAIRLANGTTTLSEECAKDGRDYATTLRQRAREYQDCIRQGIPPFQWMNAPGEPKQPSDNENE